MTIINKSYDNIKLHNTDYKQLKTTFNYLESIQLTSLP